MFQKQFPNAGGASDIDLLIKEIEFASVDMTPKEQESADSTADWLRAWLSQEGIGMRTTKLRERLERS